MTSLLSGEEHRRPLDEIEKLLIQRNAPAGTLLFQAHYEPAFLSKSTISFIASDEIAEVTLCIWSTPKIVEFEIAENLTSSRIDISSFPDQPQWMEERNSIPQGLARRIKSKMRSAIELPAPVQKTGILDGLMVDAAMLILNERKNSFHDHEPMDQHLQYFWRLCYLAMSCLEEKRSLKYLIALTGWLISK